MTANWRLEFDLAAPYAVCVYASFPYVVASVAIGRRRDLASSLRPGDWLEHDDAVDAAVQLPTGGLELCRLSPAASSAGKFGKIAAWYFTICCRLLQNIRELTC